MKKYSSKRAKKGKTAYRTPSGFICRKSNINRSFKKSENPENKRSNREILKK